MEIVKIGFGGGCHWCTEAVFQSLKGVVKVEQGWIGSVAPHDSLSEAVIVYFDAKLISLHVLIEVHLNTHSSQSNHKFRAKYRSAIYTFNEEQREEGFDILKQLTKQFDKELVTRVMPFESFRVNKEKFLNYYAKNPEKAFCTTRIKPKLEILKKKFTKHYKMHDQKLKSNITE